MFDPLEEIMKTNRNRPAIQRMFGILIIFAAAATSWSRAKA
jgi:hypothetical protein